MCSYWSENNFFIKNEKSNNSRFKFKEHLFPDTHCQYGVFWLTHQSFKTKHRSAIQIPNRRVRDLIRIQNTDHIKPAKNLTIHNLGMQSVWLVTLITTNWSFWGQFHKRLHAKIFTTKCQKNYAFSMFNFILLLYDHPM